MLPGWGAGDGEALEPRTDQLGGGEEASLRSSHSPIRCPLSLQVFLCDDVSKVSLPPSLLGDLAFCRLQTSPDDSTDRKCLHALIHNAVYRDEHRKILALHSSLLQPFLNARH